MKSFADQRLERLETELFKLKEERQIREKIKELERQIDEEKKAIKMLNPSFFMKLFTKGGY